MLSGSIVSFLVYKKMYSTVWKIVYVENVDGVYNFHVNIIHENSFFKCYLLLLLSIHFNSKIMRLLLDLQKYGFLSHFSCLSEKDRLMKVANFCVNALKILYYFEVYHFLCINYFLHFFFCLTDTCFSMMNISSRSSLYCY